MSLLCYVNAELADLYCVPVGAWRPDILALPTSTSSRERVNQSAAAGRSISQSQAQICCSVQLNRAWVPMSELAEGQWGLVKKGKCIFALPHQIAALLFSNIIYQSGNTVKHQYSSRDGQLPNVCSSSREKWQIINSCKGEGSCGF